MRPLNIMIEFLTKTGNANKEPVHFLKPDGSHLPTRIFRSMVLVRGVDVPRIHTQWLCEISPRPVFYAGHWHRRLFKQLVDLRHWRQKFVSLLRKSRGRFSFQVVSTRELLVIEG